MVIGREYGRGWSGWFANGQQVSLSEAAAGNTPIFQAYVLESVIASTMISIIAQGKLEEVKTPPVLTRLSLI